MSKISALLLLLVLPFGASAQNKWKPDQFQIHFNPGLGVIHYNEPLSLHTSLYRKLGTGPFGSAEGTYFGQYTNQPIRSLMQSDQLPLMQFGFSLGWEQASNKYKPWHTRFDLGLNYQIHPGRRSEYRQKLPDFRQMNADTNIQSAIMIFEEVLDLVELVAKYQVRLNSSDAKYAFYFGFASRIGTELFYRQISEKSFDTQYDATTTEVNSTLRTRTLNSKRGVYFSLLIPVTYEWQFSPKWAFITNFQMGRGMVNYGAFLTGNVEHFSLFFIDFGLRYRIATQ
ncbi:MAG: hypothetical protein ACK417_00950 [Bacteroidia bacterium]